MSKDGQDLQDPDLKWEGDGEEFEKFCQLTDRDANAIVVHFGIYREVTLLSSSMNTGRKRSSSGRNITSTKTVLSR